MFPRSHYCILSIIGNTDGITRRAIADTYGVKYQSASVGNALKQLRLSGWITRKGGIGQSVGFSITDVGREALALATKLEAME